MVKLGQLLILLLVTGLLSACPEKCFCNSKVVDCRSIALRNFPPGTDPDTETLFLDENSLIGIPQNAFENLKNLNYLGLSSNRLHLQNYTFDLLLKLQALDLSANHLSELREDIFGNLPNLTWLNLANNHLQRLPIVTPLAKLTYLDLSSNEFTVLQDTLGHLPQLDTLFLNNNRLKSLPATVFDQLFHLGVLDLSNNELSSLPPQFFDKRHKLTDLRLDHNRLKNLTATLFAHQHVLQYLTISGNDIAHFPTQLFGNLTKLSKLDLSNNSLTLLPYNFLSNLEELQTLNLSGNFIGELAADTFRYNPKLAYLQLDSNNLSSLPVFEGLPLLEELTLSFNRLVGFPRGFDDNLAMLKCLQVTDNLIRHWDTEVFQNITSVLLKNNPICLTKVKAAPLQSTNLDCRKKRC